MNFLQIVSIPQAIELLLGINGEVWSARERVRAADSVGRIAASDHLAASALPPFSRSTVDGFAVQSSDTFGASEQAPTLLRLCGAVQMGCEAKTDVAAGGAALIPTGGMLPEGADAVVMKEYCEQLAQDWVSVGRAVSPRENTVLCGEDAAAGEVILARGARIGARTAAVLAACGLEETTVQIRPRIALISTGDELVEPGSALAPGCIYDCNSTALEALCAEQDLQVCSVQRTGDSLPDLKEALLRAADSEMVLISGGSSAGAKDYTVRALEEIPDGDVLAHGLAAKPGKPTIVGRLGRVPVIGLPGHPAAAMMVFSEVAAAYWRRRRQSADTRRRLTVRLSEDVHASPGRQVMLLARLFPRENALWAEPVHSKSSHIRTMQQADGYLCIPPEQEGLRQGQLSEMILF
ncbi:molybdopterin molybdotransferase MoeA [Agathobaculum sp.]|uniref:molybdopterin molybdotransferase MoeA n=1 Tax=Agathobaculum sp. TaxID=2048138 RepID=UPI002A84196F|nr:molybdopterin molybdotransferase MoeA [Agathobaculum sp.]MDY3618690.1 molybdopterin molybdotransferase MoeA [Agathobaculum sp.]